MTSRSYLSIGDVLTLLRQEFPDVTISKIRFLESQGLVNPERTPSGYRKFYEHDVERLRWVLRQQREHFLPLKVIKDRLEDGSEPVAESEAASADGAPQPTTHPTEEPVLVGQRARAAATDPPAPRDGLAERVLLTGTDGAHQVPASAGSGSAGLGLASGPSSAPAAEVAAGSAGVPTADRPASPGVTNAVTNGGDGAPTGEGAEKPAPETVAHTPSVPPARRSSSARRVKAEPVGAALEVPVAEDLTEDRLDEPPTAVPAAPVGDGTSLSVEELSAACGLDVTVLCELQEFGLLVPRTVGGVSYFDEEALAVAAVAARFAQFGIEPRHLRLYKNAADREAGFVEQILLPMVRQRNPDARARAQQTADELAGLGQELRSALLRRALSDLLGV